MLFHNGLLIKALIWRTVQFSPSQMLAGGWSLLAGSVTSQVTAGRSPFCTSEEKEASGTMCCCQRVGFNRTPRIAWNEFQIYPGWPT